jgi:cysteine desulfurase
MPVYLDYAATAPLDPEVRAVMLQLFDVDFGNAGSRTHEFGARAKKAVELARSQVASAADAQAGDVIFTSGATEANNLAILGLQRFGEANGRRHVVTTAIEHKAVLEPLEALAERGFELTVLPAGPSGSVDADAILGAVRPDTLLVSVMQINNETGVRQPIAEIAAGLGQAKAYLHVDAAQGYAKEDGLKDPRIDLISVSAHKLYGPKGVGALVTKRRGYDRPPLTPLMFGGGQERGLRPGTLPVPLIGALGEAVRLGVEDGADRRAKNQARRQRALAAFDSLHPVVVGDPDRSASHILMLAFPRVDSEALMLGVRDLVAISNGSACTSASYAPSHVLTAMGLPDAVVSGAVRLSWSHAAPEPDWAGIVAAIAQLSTPAWA